MFAARAAAEAERAEAEQMRPRARSRWDDFAAVTNSTHAVARGGGRHTSHGPPPLSDHCGVGPIVCQLEQQGRCWQWVSLSADRLAIYRSINVGLSHPLVDDC